MENGWTERIKELEKMVDDQRSVIESDEKLVEELTEKLKATEEEMLFWRRESRLSDAGLNMAEDKIKELEAEVGRLQLMNPCNHTGFESAPCDVCGYPDPRKLIAKLEAEVAEARKEIERLQGEIIKDDHPITEEACKKYLREIGYQTIFRKDCFEWMRGWLESYNKDKAKEIMDWIYNQPMASQ